MKNNLDINKINEERQKHNDYINCVKEFPPRDPKKEKPYTRVEEIERNKLILKKYVAYYKATINNNNYYNLL